MGFLVSGTTRWLIIPIAICAIVLMPSGPGLLALLLLIVMFAVGLVDQGTRLGNMTPRFRLLSVSAALAVWGALAIAKIGWVFGTNSYFVVLAFALSAGAGFLGGAFFASLWSTLVSGASGRSAEARTPSQPPRLFDVLVRANKLTVFQEPARQSDELHGGTMPGDQQVEVFFDGKWRIAKVVAWETRDLGIFVRVNLVQDEIEHAQWISADLVKPIGDGVQE